MYQLNMHSKSRYCRIHTANYEKSKRKQKVASKYPTSTTAQNDTWVASLLDPVSNGQILIFTLESKSE
jgi:hypothetical protein